MSWRALLLRRRLRDQVGVLATAVLVVLVSTTLVGTFAFLVTVTSDRAVTAEVAAAPDHELVLRSFSQLRGEPGPVLDAVDEAVDDVLGDVPSHRSRWAVGCMWLLPQVGHGPVDGGYPASVPEVDDKAELVDGAWPRRARDAEGRLQVAVPVVAAQEQGWEVGTVVPTARLEAPPLCKRGDLTDTWVVTGVYRPGGSLHDWEPDRLDGAGVDHRYYVSQTSTIALYGPMVTAPGALDGTEGVAMAYHLAVPRLEGVSAATLAALRTELDGAGPLVERAMGTSAGTFRTGLDEAVDRAWRAAAVTRSGVVAVGLLLVVLAVTVMLLTARLVTERRAGDLELLAARGASPTQLRVLAALEAALLAASTTAVAPWLARGAYATLAGVGVLGPAGAPPPGVPLPVLLACAAVATLLGAALVVPAWHVRGSSAPTPRAGLVRSGADLAVVALAGVALWQLLTYGTLGGAGGLEVDPVLVAAPALVVLGAATLALRLLTPVARLADAVAARSRSLVGPLAAWQVARRPGTARGTSLVVVLTVTAATFTHAFLTTWSASQVEQVDLAVGADARVSPGPRTSALEEAAHARAAVVGSPVRLDPVLDRQVAIGRSASGALAGGAATSARLIGVDTRAPEALRGRTATTWADALAGLDLTGGGEPRGPDEPLGLALPADPEWLFARVTVETTPAADGDAWVTLALEDESGVRTWVIAEATAVNGGPDVAPFRVPAGAGALRLVGVGVSLSHLEPRVPPDGYESPSYEVSLRVEELATSTRGVRPQPSPWLALDGPLSPVPGATVTWDGGVLGPEGTPLLPDDAAVPDEPGPPAGVLVTGGYDEPVDGGGLLVVHAWPAQSRVRAVVDERLVAALGLGVGDVVVVDVATLEVPVVVQAVVPHVPGAPRGPALLVDREALSRAVAERWGSDALVDGWRLTGEPEDVAAVAARMTAATGGEATLLAAERTTAVGGPLAVALPTSLRLATATAAVLVVVGLGAAAMSAVRGRRLETARVQALGAPRSALVAGLLGEHALLVCVGALAGLGVGHGAAAVVVPVLTAAPDGRRPVPEAVLRWVWGSEAALTAGLVVAAGAVVALVVATSVRRASGTLLRLGDDH